MTNFEFLKSIDKNLYEIIRDAEELYRDEYFEQCITQTRRFGENVCKNVLGPNRTTEKTFDEMLATLKDKSSNEEQEKEFIDDLYFLKREGNTSTHSGAVKQEATLALECLQRSFEVGLNYALYRSTSSKKTDLLKLRYDTELLITGEKSKQTLAEKFAEEKARNSRSCSSEKKSEKTTKKGKKQTPKTKTKAKAKKPKNKSGFTWFKFFITVSAFISAVLVLTIYLLTIV